MLFMCTTEFPDIIFLSILVMMILKGNVFLIQSSTSWPLTGAHNDADDNDRDDHGDGNDDENDERECFPHSIKRLLTTHRAHHVCINTIPQRIQWKALLSFFPFHPFALWYNGDEKSQTFFLFSLWWSKLRIVWHKILRRLKTTFNRTHLKKFLLRSPTPIGEDFFLEVWSPMDPIWLVILQLWFLSSRERGEGDPWLFLSEI